MSKTIFHRIAKKGIIESLYVACSLFGTYLRSFLHTSLLQWRGYHVHSTVLFKGNAFFSQTTKKSIAINEHTVVGNNVRIDSGYEGKIHIGHHVLIDDNCFITAQHSVVIGNNVLIAAYSFITDFNHSFAKRGQHIRDQGFIRKSVLIDDDVWIGTHCIILPGVTIGKGAVVGAGSVVTKDVPPYTIIAGNPAKKIGHRS